jgi:hypothetical protein
MPQISLDWETVKRSYPMRPLIGPLKTFMDHTPGTPCCVQMCHALIGAGFYPGPKSNWRNASQITTVFGTRNYVLAVNEMTWLLERNFGMGEELSKPVNGQRPSHQTMQAALNGRTGILVFKDLGAGTHTELWDVDHMHQPRMSDALFDAPKVLFWDVMITATA